MSEYSKDRQFVSWSQRAEQSFTVAASCFPDIDPQIGISPGLSVYPCGQGPKIIVGYDKARRELALNCKLSNLAFKR